MLLLLAIIFVACPNSFAYERETSSGFGCFSLVTGNYNNFYHSKYQDYGVITYDRSTTDTGVYSLNSSYPPITLNTTSDITSLNELPRHSEFAINQTYTPVWNYYSISSGGFKFFTGNTTNETPRVFNQQTGTSSFQFLLKEGTMCQSAEYFGVELLTGSNIDYASKILINGISPTSVTPAISCYNSGSYHCSVSGYFNSYRLPATPGITTITPTLSDGSWYYGTIIDMRTIVNCDETINDFSATNNGGGVVFSGDIFSTKPISWKLQLPGWVTYSDLGSSVSYVWDGKDVNGKAMPQGSYSATLRATTTNGFCFTSKFVNFDLAPSCKLKITSFQGTATTLDPSSGGSIPFSGTISNDSGTPMTWTITLPNGSIKSGSDISPSATWDGTDSNGKIVEPGSYTATLTVQTADGKCHDTSSASVNVQWNAQCSLDVPLGSSANVASGALTQSQELFAARIGALPLTMALSYNSLDPHNGSLGTGWSHSYDVFLKATDNGLIVLHEGNGKRKLYTLTNGSYVSQPGDYATLVKNTGGTFTLTQKDGTRYDFTAEGKIAATVDRNSNAATFAYTNGNLASVTDPAGRKATLSYDAANHLSSITDPTGNSYTFTYNGNTLASVANPDGGEWRYTYDANAFMLSKTDPLGNVTTYAYDANHRVASSTDPEGKLRSVTYPQPGADTTKNTVFTEKDGGVWTYRYDTQAGTLTSKTDPQGGVTSYTYDGNGNRLSTTLPDGTMTTSTYDAVGNMTSASDALGQITSYTYNSFGQVLIIKDPQGNSTGYSYDATGNMTSMTDAVGATTLYSYDARGNVTKITNPLGQATTFTYDAAENLASVTDPTGATMSYTYDAAGNMLSQTDAGGATSQYEYNVKNQVVKVTDPQWNATSYTYDLSGNKLSQVDANGNTTKYEYNYKGQLTKTTDALGNITTYTYSGTGCSSCGGGTDKLVALTDANGNSTNYQYDPLGKLVSETDPLGNVTSSNYDAKGNQTSKTDGNGNTISYTYDGNGRLLKKSYPDGTEEIYTYDVRGNILTATNQHMGYSFNYDAASKVTKITDSTGKVISYAYDAVGNRTKMVTPDGRTITYSYDKAGRLTNILDGGIFTFDYDGLGRRSSLEYPNGDMTSYGYDKDGRLASLVQKNAKGAIIASNSYTLDKIGNRFSNTSQDRSTSYTYDAIYRLTQALSSTPGYSTNSTGKGGGIPKSTQPQKEFYTFDPVGNRLSSDKTNVYVYNQGNQLVINDVTYSYDRNGNLISKSTLEGTTTYSWDYENRLVKVTMPDGTIAEYAYDPFGKRIGKKVMTNGTITNTRYFYDNDNILFEYNDAGTIGNRYTHGPGVDEHLMITTGKDKYYYHADGLGSTITLTDSTGSAVQTYNYDSFGNMKDQKNRVEQPYTYTGREWDKETGLYYYRARYYNPMEGRFIQKDPIAILGNIYNSNGKVTFSQYVDAVTNPYLYVQNNPINLIDPTGLFWQYLPAIRDVIYNIATQRPGQTMATLEKCVNYVKDNANRPRENPPPPIEGYNPAAQRPYDNPTAPTPIKPQMYQ